MSVQVVEKNTEARAEFVDDPVRIGDMFAELFFEPRVPFVEDVLLEVVGLIEDRGGEVEDVRWVDDRHLNCKQVFAETTQSRNLKTCDRVDFELAEALINLQFLRERVLVGVNFQSGIA